MDKGSGEGKVLIFRIALEHGELIASQIDNETSYTSHTPRDKLQIQLDWSMHMNGYQTLCKCHFGVI